MASSKKSKQSQSQRKTGSLEPGAGAAGGPEKKRARRSGRRPGHSSPEAPSAPAARAAGQPDADPCVQPSIPGPGRSEPADSAEQPAVSDALQSGAATHDGHTERGLVVSPPRSPVGAEVAAAEQSLSASVVADDADVAASVRADSALAAPVEPKADLDVEALRAPELGPSAIGSDRPAQAQSMPTTGGEASALSPPTAVGDSVASEVRLPAGDRCAPLRFDRIPFSVEGFRAAWQSAPDAASRIDVVANVTDTLLRLLVALELGVVGTASGRARLDAAVVLASRGRLGEALSIPQWGHLAWGLARVAARAGDDAVAPIAAELTKQQHLERTLDVEFCDIRRVGPADGEVRAASVLEALVDACQAIRNVSIIGVTSVLGWEGDNAIQYEVSRFSTQTGKLSIWSDQPLLRRWCYVAVGDGVGPSLLPMAFTSRCDRCGDASLFLATRIVFGPSRTAVPGTCVSCGRAGLARLPPGPAHPLARMTLIF